MSRLATDLQAVNQGKLLEIVQSHPELEDAWVRVTLSPRTAFAGLTDDGPQDAIYLGPFEFYENQ